MEEATEGVDGAHHHEATQCVSKSVPVRAEWNETLRSGLLSRLWLPRLGSRVVVASVVH